MLHVRRDDHQIARLYMMGFVVEEKIAFSIDDEKDFGKMMRVQNALPVLLVLCQGNGEKAGVQLFYVGILKGILSVAHEILL